MRSFPVRWWCFLLLCAMGMPVQSAVHLYDDEQMQLLADNFSVYRENREQLTIGEVLKLRHEFIYQADNNPNYGFSENGLWLHADRSTTPCSISSRAFRRCTWARLPRWAASFWPRASPACGSRFRTLASWCTSLRAVRAAWLRISRSRHARSCASRSA